MARLLDSMEGELAEKILVSPEMGVRQVREVLKL